MIFMVLRMMILRLRGLQSNKRSGSDLNRTIAFISETIIGSEWWVKKTLNCGGTSIPLMVSQQSKHFLK